jgi:hypothetical protein
MSVYMVYGDIEVCYGLHIIVHQDSEEANTPRAQGCERLVELPGCVQPHCRLRVCAVGRVLPDCLEACTCVHRLAVSFLISRIKVVRPPDKDGAVSCDHAPML